MGKLIRIEFTKLRWYPAVWIVVLVTLAQGVFFAFTGRYDNYIAYYPRQEHIIYAYSTGRWFCMAAIFLTSYVIAGDYSMRTVLNVLSAGVDKRKYYFSRLAAMLLFFFALFACGNLVYIATRFLVRGRVSAAVSVGEFLVMLLVMGMQVAAYVAVANLVSLCCKKQALSIIVGEITLFLILLLRLNLVGEEYYANVNYQLSGPIAFEPMYVLEEVDTYMYAWESLFGFGFLKYALSAAVIILVAGAAGYVCSLRSDVQ